MTDKQEIRFIPIGTKIYAVRESSRSIYPGRVIGHSVSNNQLFHEVIYYLDDSTEFGGGSVKAEKLETDLSSAEKRIFMTETKP